LRPFVYSVILVLFVAALPFRALAQEGDRFADNYIGETVIYKADHEDTFIELAREYNLGFVEMRAANPGIDPWLPGEGREIVIPAQHLLPDAPRKGIVINLPEMRLYYYPADGSAPLAYSIGIGREGLSTPLGTTKIVNKIEDPEWRPTKRMREEDPELPEVVPAGPENPLGTHALYLAWPQYRIHGTNKPYGIGRRVSSGCIRLYPEGIVDLYDRIEKGTMVTVVDQPVKTGWIDNTFYVEAHPTIEQADQVEMDGYIATYRLDEGDLRRILHAAGDYVSELNWPLIRKVIRERKGYPVAIATRPEVIGQSETVDVPVSEEAVVTVTN
jgi:L,D-transpeptidase ErfK/SrfK